METMRKPNENGEEWLGISNLCAPTWGILAVASFFSQVACPLSKNKKLVVFCGTQCEETNLKVCPVEIYVVGHLMWLRIWLVPWCHIGRIYGTIYETIHLTIYHYGFHNRGARPSSVASFLVDGEMYGVIYGAICATIYGTIAPINSLTTSTI